MTEKLKNLLPICWEDCSAKALLLIALLKIARHQLATMGQHPTTTIEETDNPNFLQLLTQVFGQLAVQLEIETLDSKLLKHVLPPTRTSFNNVSSSQVNNVKFIIIWTRLSYDGKFTSLLRIEHLLEESDDLDEETAICISKSLQACLDILSGYGELIEILTKDVLKADSVDSLNKNLPLILVDAFTHCKHSESNYGSYFEESTTILTAFFKKSYEIQSKYYKLVEERIDFSTSLESDDECLLLVMNSALKMAEIIVSLDLKTSADQWKLYGKLYSKHAPHLRNAVDTSEPLCLLIAHFEQILGVLVTSQETTSEKQRMKLLKIGNFLLKLIIKLCELSECNFRHGWADVLQLLILLSGCSRSQVSPGQFSDDLRRYIVVGATPLLNVLIKEEDFFKEFDRQKDACDQLSQTQRIGKLFLCLTLMKMVIEKKAPPCWNRIPFVKLVLDCYDSCGSSVDLNEQFEGHDVYSSLVSITTAFLVATVEETQLPEVENCLVTHLVTGELHTAIFVMDVFCLIGRLTSDEYCLHLATYLCETLRVWPKLSTDQIERTLIGVLIRRLWCLLSAKSREALSTRYSSRDTSRVLYWLDGCDSYNKQVLDNYVGFVENPSIASYVDILASPPFIGREPMSNSSSMSDVVVAQTLRIILFLGRKSSEDQVWCIKLLMTSLKLILNLTPSISSEQLTQVFEHLKTLAATCGESTILTVFWFLAQSTRHVLATAPSPRLIRAVAALLIKCLATDNQTLVISSLRVLETYDKSPDHKEIVMLVSSHSEAIFNTVNSHLQRTSAPLVATSVGEMLSVLPRTPHTCRAKSSKPVDIEVVPPPAKKTKTDLKSGGCESAACLQRIAVETNILKGLHRNTELSDDLKQQLNSIVKELSALC